MQIPPLPFCSPLLKWWAGSTCCRAPGSPPRSLAGPDPALRIAGLASADVEISKTGKYGASLAHELLDELEARSARWGLISAADSVLLIERI